MCLFLRRYIEAGRWIDAIRIAKEVDTAFSGSIGMKNASSILSGVDDVNALRSLYKNTVDKV
jgi:hypothetical protein